MSQKYYITNELTQHELDSIQLACYNGEVAKYYEERYDEPLDAEQLLYNKRCDTATGLRIKHIKIETTTKTGLINKISKYIKKNKLLEEENKKLKARIQELENQ